MLAKLLPVSSGLLELEPKLRAVVSVQVGCWPLRFKLKKTPVLSVCAPLTSVRLSVHANWRPSLAHSLGKAGKLQAPIPQLKFGNRLRKLASGKGSWNLKPSASRS